MPTIKGRADIIDRAVALRLMEEFGTTAHQARELTGIALCRWKSENDNKEGV